MGVVDRLDRWMWRRPSQRSGYPLSFNDWLTQMSYNGIAYSLQGGTLVDDTEKVGAGFSSYVNGAFKGNAVVFACEASRLTLFTEARFQWREIRNGRPGNLFGSPELRILEEPWPGGTTGDLLARMLLDADMAGNSFTLRRLDRLTRLRPDWVSLLYDGDPWEPATELKAYAYQPGGPGGGKEPMILLPEEVAHFAPMPDPMSPRRGMSWLTPVVREIDADIAATTHKGAMFAKGGTPNMIVKTDTTVTKELFEAVVKLYREGHEDASNAGKAWFVQSGFDPTVVGSNLQELDFKTVQGGGESRIAAASGIHPVIVGLSEGLQGASLNAGNFNSARRLTADKTLRPLWRNVAGSLEWLVTTPQVTAGKAELWYDERDVAFLHDDRKDAAEMQVSQSSAMKQLIDAGYDPDTVTDAITSNDYNRLKHTGKVSVQLQEPGAIALPAPPQNGKVPEPALGG